MAIEEEEKPYLKYFKAQKKTNRFNLNQRVYITLEHPNHLDIRFKWRSKGRYVSGVIDKLSKTIGPIYDYLIY